MSEIKVKRLIEKKARRKNVRPVTNENEKKVKSCLNAIKKKQVDDKNSTRTH